MNFCYSSKIYLNLLKLVAQTLDIPLHSYFAFFIMISEVNEFGFCLKFHYILGNGIKIKDHFLRFNPFFSDKRIKESLVYNWCRDWQPRINNSCNF